MNKEVPMNAPARQMKAASLPLKFGFDAAYYRLAIAGGPFDRRPKLEKSFNVCVRAENVPADAVHAHLPIEDFSVPGVGQEAQVSDVLFKALKAAIDGKEVYVGCMGGVGRTGLFLALLAKAAGVAKPVDYVREHYDRRAVETLEQKLYVNRFDVGALRVRLFWYAWTSRLLWWWRV